MKKEIEKVFTSKLTPAISAEKRTLDEIVQKRADLVEKIREITTKLEASQVALQAIEKKLEEAVLEGSSTNAQLRTAEQKRTEAEIFSRELNRLVQAEADVAGHEASARKALAGAISAALLACRSDIEGKVREHLSTALGLMAAFDQQAKAAFLEHGTSMPQFSEIGRFLNLASWADDLEGYISPVGADVSAMKRKEIRDRLQAG